MKVHKLRTKNFYKIGPCLNEVEPGRRVDYKFRDKVWVREIGAESYLTFIRHQTLFHTAAAKRLGNS
jgi:hypothetical protein